MAIYKSMPAPPKPKRSRTETLTTNQVLFTMWMDRDERQALREFAQANKTSMAEVGRQGIMSIIGKKKELEEPAPESTIGELHNEQ
ncbi:MAG: hypothetical protein ACERKS_13210 [Candidatus Bathyarchaeota archaeon]